MSEYKENNIVMEDRWIGIEEIAFYLGVKPITIRSWLKKENPIPAHRIGKLWRFKKTEVDEWVRKISTYSK